MAKIFYDHLIAYEETIALLETHNLDPEEKGELIRLIDSIYHHHLLNLILNYLPPSHHQEFMARLYQDPASPELLIFLKDSITVVDIELEIQKHGQKIKNDIVKEIQKSQTRHSQVEK